MSSARRNSLPAPRARPRNSPRVTCGSRLKRLNSALSGLAMPTGRFIGGASRWLHTAADVDESPAPRIAALRALEALGAHAASVRAALDPLSRDEDPEIREAAKRALAAIDAAGGDAS